MDLPGDGIFWWNKRTAHSQEVEESDKDEESEKKKLIFFESSSRLWTWKLESNDYSLNGVILSLRAQCVDLGGQREETTRIGVDEDAKERIYWSGDLIFFRMKVKTWKMSYRKKIVKVVICFILFL